MLNMDQLIHDLEGLDVNLYRFAVYTPEEGVRAHQFRPCSRCCNCYSVAKAFVVTAIGLLQADGLLSADDLISRHLPIPEGADPRWQQATIDHALRHRLGFGEGFLDIDTEDTDAYPTDDYLEMVFAHPLAHDPGTVEVYSDAAFYLLSRLISRVAGEGMDSLLWRRVLKPLGFGEIAWSRCPLEHPIGATGLYARTEDVVKLGALYMQGGLWQGQQLLPRAWVEEVLARGYEFRPQGTSVLIGKGGMYGQCVLFSPEKGFAAAWHAFDQQGGKAKIVRLLGD